MSGDIFGCDTGVGNAIGIEWVEAKDAAKYPTIRRTAPERILRPVSITQFEEPCSGVGSTGTSSLAHHNPSSPSSPADLLLLVPVPCTFPGTIPDSFLSSTHSPKQILNL